MLKYQVKSTSSSPRSASSGSSPTSYSSMSMTSLLIDDTLLAIPTTSRSNSLLSLNSTDSSLSDFSEVGILRVDTRTVKQCTDYKTIRVTSATTCKNVIEKFMSTLKLSCRDPNLFEIWMELTTRSGGAPITTLLKLDDESRPYELQRCHPTGMSRFILLQNPAGYLVRVHDHNICQQSNYKSMLLSPKTNVQESIQIILALNRKSNEDPRKYGLFLNTPEADAQIPNDVSLVSIARLCKDGQKIVIRHTDFL